MTEGSTRTATFILLAAFYFLLPVLVVMVSLKQEVRENLSYGAILKRKNEEVHAVSKTKEKVLAGDFYLINNMCDIMQALYSLNTTWNHPL